MIPAAVFSAAARTLDTIGYSSERVVARAKLPPYQFLEPHSKIPGIHMYRLFAQAAREIGDAAFGTMVADREPITSLPGLGRAMSVSPTPYAAVTTISRLYSSATNVARFWTVAAENEGIWWLRKSFLPSCVGARQLEIASLAYMVQTVRAASRSDWRPATIRLERDSIPQLNRLEPFGDAEVQYNRGVTGIAIPPSVLSRFFVPSAPEDTVDAERMFTDAAAEGLVGSLTQLLRSMIRLAPPRIQAVAEIGGMHPRTLQRRLEAEGLTFKKLVDQSRFLETADLMRDEDVPLVDIAHAVGYSDQAHFNHAFRRWAGVTPSSYRSQLHQG